MLPVVTNACPALVAATAYGPGLFGRPDGTTCTAVAEDGLSGLIIASDKSDQLAARSLEWSGVRASPRSCFVPETVGGMIGVKNCWVSAENTSMWSPALR